jgi:hypothetical protein
LLTGSCEQQEARIYGHGKYWPLSLSPGYNAQQYYLQWEHQKLKSIGLRSDGYIYKGVK